MNAKAVNYLILLTLPLKLKISLIFLIPFPFNLGTNKSWAIKSILKEYESIEEDLFGESRIRESGTLDGLMCDLIGNQGNILGVFDEFSVCVDNMDKGNSGTAERGRYLSLYDASNWMKSTKSSGTVKIEDPRFNLISFTQPYFALNFSRNSTCDGFYQRFLLTIPQEVFVTFDQKEAKINEITQTEFQMSTIFKNIAQECKGGLTLHLDDDALTAFKCYHDSVERSRKIDLFTTNGQVSLRAKSKGLVLRIAGVISLLRCSISNAFSYKVTGSDFAHAMKIVEYSIQNSIAMLSNNSESSVSTKNAKSSLPSPQNLTVDFLIPHSAAVKRVLNNDTTLMADISRFKMYPIINDVKNASVGESFVKGLENLGFGKIILSNGRKMFKRYHPCDANCPDKENLVEKWRKLNMTIEEELN